MPRLAFDPNRAALDEKERREYFASLDRYEQEVPRGSMLRAVYDLQDTLGKKDPKRNWAATELINSAYSVIEIFAAQTDKRFLNASYSSCLNVDYIVKVGRSYIPGDLPYRPEPYSPATKALLEVSVKIIPAQGPPHRGLVPDVRVDEFLRKARIWYQDRYDRLMALVPFMLDACWDESEVYLERLAGEMKLSRQLVQRANDLANPIIVWKD